VLLDLLVLMVPRVLLDLLVLLDLKVPLDLLELQAPQEPRALLDQSVLLVLQVPAALQVPPLLFHTHTVQPLDKQHLAAAI
jgi:hypothetical protein